MSILGSTQRVGYTPSRRPLWSADEFLRWGGMVAAGGVAIVAGWYLASGTPHYSQAIGYTNVAVVGMLVAAWGHAIMLLRGRRSVGERRRELLRDVIGQDPASSGLLRAQELGSDTGPAASLVAGEGMKHFHRLGCPLAQGRDWREVSLEEHLGAGRTPCGVCRP